MGKVKTRIATLLLAVMVCLSALFVPTMSVAYAAENIPKFDGTDVLDDLRSMEGFSLLKYPFYESAKPEMRVIDLVEYCYDYRENMRKNYGLYIYVYNPNGQDILTDSDKNKIQIAVSYDTYPVTGKSVATDWDKFDLQFCSMSTDVGTNRLFYKFKVIDHESEDGKTIAQRVNSMERRYDVSGIELHTSGNPNATEYGVATSYHFTGYAEGYGDGSGNGVSLTRGTLETIELDLHSTTYRFPYINENGAGHQNQLDSVYFAIPKEYDENYGDLYRVKCSWNEQKTTPVIVTNDKDIYADVVAHLGTDGSDGEYHIYDRYSATTMGTGASNAAWAYNRGNTIAPVKPYVGYAFLSDKSNVKDTDITSSQMKDWIYGHNYADFLFADAVDEGRTKGYQERTFTADEPFNMLSFNASASGWKKFCQGWQEFWTGRKWNWGGNDETEVEPIRLVTDKDFTGTDVTDAGKLYVHADDFDEFEKFYKTNKAANNVFLLRFAVTDYYSNMQTVFDSGFFSTADKKSTYMAQETVFLDFDIIELTFKRDTTETIIPVVASPIDVVGGISAPIVTEGLAWWKIVLALLALIILVLILWPVMPYVIRALLWIILLPFKAIAALFRAISNSIKKRRREKNDTKK